MTGSVRGASSGAFTAVEMRSLIHRPRSFATALGRLAARYGIEAGFRDARGKDIVTRPETQVRLLNGMGVKAETERQASSALEELDRAAWQFHLPSVIVARDENDVCTIEVILRDRAQTLQWRAQLENGAERSGSLAVAGLELVDRDDRSGAEKRRLSLYGLPQGYHRLQLPELGAETSLIVTPKSCWLPDRFRNGPGLWGIAVQLPLLRSARNWGIGDFSDLAELGKFAANHGCGLIGVNPLHQMFLEAPERASPYSPATRLHLNTLYIDVTRIPEFAHCQHVQQVMQSSAFQIALAQCRVAPLVDYSDAASLKIKILRTLFSVFVEGADKAREEAFRRFVATQGESLERSAIFQVLRQHFSIDDLNRADWRRWPREFQDVGSQAVSRFAEEHRDDVDFLVWLQFVADEQLAAIAGSFAKSGVAIGLYRDLAVGCDRLGAETWANAGAFINGAAIGAPPDIFNPAGQNWDLPPFQPNALRSKAYLSFIELVRANMRHAGGLRIDHVMGLQHLYCIPDGEEASRGTYVQYPIDDLVGILALESQRQRCLVVGEDLGTVPDGFREKMAAADILSYRVLFFEQDGETGEFTMPVEYPRLSVAVAGNHDLATLRGWWEAGDINLKASLGLYPSEYEINAQRDRRERDRQAILKAFQSQGVLPRDEEISVEQFAFAAYEFLAHTGSVLVVAQLDDMTGEVDPVNVPGTSQEHPNWRRKYQMTLEDLASDDAPWQIVEILTALRGGRQTCLGS
jgi:4-alpha-glucanotransferase